MGPMIQRELRSFDVLSGAAGCTCISRLLCCGGHAGPCTPLVQWPWLARPGLPARPQEFLIL